MTSESSAGMISLPICREHLELVSVILPRLGNSSSKGNGTRLGQLLQMYLKGLQSTSSSPVYWFQVLLPMICTLGISGNILNLVVLTRKRFFAPMGRLERSANIGLAALAFSDMMFCVSVFPHSFIPLDKEFLTVTHDDVFILYYKIYGISTINLFLMISTWLIVALAIERYIALFYPLRAKWLLSLKRNKAILIVVYVVSILLTLPYFINKRVRKCMALDKSTMYETWSLWPLGSILTSSIEVYIRHVWPAVAVFLPLVVLFVCNVRLIQGLRKVPSKRRLKCPGQKIRDVNTRITLTLIIIVATALILVTPSEILKVINPYQYWGIKVGRIIAAVSNLLQSLNFAFNFILYCAIDRHFRHICRNYLLGKICLAKRKRASPNTDLFIFYQHGTGYTTSYRNKSNLISSSKSSSRSDRDVMFM